MSYNLNVALSRLKDAIRQFDNNARVGVTLDDGDLARWNSVATASRELRAVLEKDKQLNQEKT